MYSCNDTIGEGFGAFFLSSACTNLMNLSVNVVLKITGMLSSLKRQKWTKDVIHPRKDEV